MSLSYHDWPFRPANQRSFEENERWWQECFVAPSELLALARHPLWAILTGVQGGGKSTTLQALQRLLKTDGSALLIEYTTERWAEVGSSHFERLAELITEELRQFFLDHQSALAWLSADDKLFLRWMIEKYKNSRAYRVWLGNLELESADCMKSIEYEDLYPSFEQPEYVGEFIYDLLSFCRKISYSQVVILVDLSDPLNGAQAENLDRLYAWMEPMHHPGFRIITALTQSTADQIRFTGQIKQRISFQHLDTTGAWMEDVAVRILNVASDGQIKSLFDLFSATALEAVKKWMEEEFATITPSVWGKVAQAALKTAKNADVPLHIENLDAFYLNFYSEFALLKPGENEGYKGAWRGERFLRLNPGEFYLLEKVYKRQGLPYASGEKNLANSIYQSVKRIREIIEPDPAHPIYFITAKNEGYHLEHFVPLPPVHLPYKK